MPVISKMRLTNLVYDNGLKQYADETFQFDGHNGVVLLENSGGKTVFIQAVLQAVMPHCDLGERKIRDTLSLEGGACHIAVEWIINERPRRYAMTAVSLFLHSGVLDSLRYTYDYGDGDANCIDKLPFAIDMAEGRKRPATRQEMSEYFSRMQSANSLSGAALKHDTIASYMKCIEEKYHIAHSEWNSIRKINSAEGDVERFFDDCRMASQLIDRLIIPVVEDAIGGEGKESFSGTFHKQREHFKKYKRLQEKISESQLIEVRIDDYVKAYALLNARQCATLEKKQRLKQVFGSLQGLKSGNDIQIDSFIQAIFECDALELQLNAKASSLSLAKADKVIEEIQVELEPLQRQLEIWGRQSDEQKQLKENLELAKLRGKIAAGQQQKTALQNQIESLDYDEESLQLQDSYDRNLGLLRGHYITWEAGLTRKSEKLVLEQRNAKSRLEQLEAELEGRQEQKMQLMQKQSALGGRIKSMDESLKQIESKILDNRETDNIEAAISAWKKRAVDIETELRKCIDESARMQITKRELTDSIRKIYENRSQTQSELAVLKNKMAGLDADRLSLLERVRQEKGNWRYIDNIYQRQETLIDGLGHSIEKLRREIELLLQKERVELRMLDDYANSSVFAAEPLLAGIVERLQDDYEYIELGSDYLARIAAQGVTSLGKLQELSPCWAMAVITTGKVVQRLRQALADRSRDFTRPVIVWALEEIESDQIGMQIKGMIIPDYWNDNLNYESFGAWIAAMELRKQELQIQIASKRREQETGVGLLADLQSFFQMHPFEEDQAMQQQHGEHEQKVEALSRQLSDIEQKLAETEERICVTADNQYALGIEAENLSGKMADAMRYLSLVSEKDACNKEAYAVAEKLPHIEVEIGRNRMDVAEVRDVRERLQAGLVDIQIKEKTAKAQESYRKSLDAQPIFEEVSLSGLESELERLSRELGGLQKGRESLEIELGTTQRQLGDDAEELAVKLATAAYPVDMKLEFFKSDNQRLNACARAVHELEERCSVLQKDFEKGSKKADRLKILQEAACKSHMQAFGEKIAFDFPLAQVEQEIDRDLKKSEAKRQESAAQRGIYVEKGAQLAEAIRLIEMENAGYGFLFEGIQAAEPDQELERSLPYTPVKLANEQLEAIRQLQEQLEIVKKDTDRAAMRFRQFCNENIADIKLRENAIDGVDRRDTYAQILDWQLKMNHKIETVIRIAQGDMREHDKERSQFIQLLHTYLQQLAKEIELVPRSTRVKQIGEAKELFVFEVPGWEEADGKEALSDFLDKLLERFETDAFKDEKGLDNEAAIIREIDRCFKSKELLRTVMKGREIKVKCRKIANDNSISGIQYSWETSNKWSGGEKWSKNMCLFMGILNYAAEKSGYVTNNARRSRCVILDNPFGKASSDHVLNPVFFIAEKLGFQIIALTAHAEGKFVRDRFPVVFSLVLRPTGGSDVNLIEIEDRKINQAWFKDSDPAVQLRLSDVEQLTLL